MRCPSRRLFVGPVLFVVGLTALAPAQTRQTAIQITLPQKEGSLKFAAIGDNGTGDAAQYEVGQRMAEAQALFPFELVVMLGDNMYGSQRPQDYEKKFERPYKALLDANVKFYASLGNHDDREQRFYKFFNMNGDLYYTFKAPRQDVRFFALDSTYLEPRQIQWLERELKASNDNWKIVFFHHPLYSSGERHGSSVQLRETLEPLFVKYNVSAVFSGHDHFYERIKVQKGIFYMVSGAGGKLRRGNIEDRSALTEKGFDSDNHFVLLEIYEDEMYLQAISRKGLTIDSGSFRRRQANTTSSGPVGR